MINIELHEAQSDVYQDLFIDKICRHSVVCASRGFGKSFLAAATAGTAVMELLDLNVSVPNKNVLVIAPTYTQVTEIYYPYFAYQMGFESLSKASRDAGIFRFPRNVNLKLVSFEAIERERGKGAYFIVGDEIPSWTRGIGAKKAWEGIIEPLLTTRWSPARAKEYGATSPGRSLSIATPKGYDFFYEMFHFEETDPDWKAYHYDYTKSPYLDIKEIEKVKRRVDPIEFAREYKASFSESGASVFYCFDRKKHVTSDVLDFQPGEDVHVAIDFNVMVQATSAWAIRGGQPQCIMEFKGHPDTDTLARVLKKQFIEHRIFAYPDPTGKARKTSAPVGINDFKILESYGIKCLSKKGSPSIIDSATAVNRKLLNAAEEVDVYIHPRCKGVIESLERTVWVEGRPDLAVIDKSEGVEHFSDGIRYFFDYKFPINVGSKVASVGHNF